MNFTACFFFLGVSQTFQTYFSPAPPQAPGESAAFAGGVFFWEPKKRQRGGNFGPSPKALSPHSWLTPSSTRARATQHSHRFRESPTAFGVKQTPGRNRVFTEFGWRNQRLQVKVSDGGCWSSIQAWKKTGLIGWSFKEQFTNLETVCLKID